MQDVVVDAGGDGEAPEQAAPLLVDGESADVGLVGIGRLKMQSESCVSALDGGEVAARPFDQFDAVGDLIAVMVQVIGAMSSSGIEVMVSPGVVRGR
jgi:hypothetical protein